MESSPSRRLHFVGTALIGLFLGLLVAFLTRPARGLHTIKVIPGNPLSSGPTVMPDPETIYIRYGDIVKWISETGGRVEIRFKATDYDPNSSATALKEPPFNGGSAGADQSINCASYSCTSLDINRNLGSYLDPAHPERKLTYKYTQILDGNPRDGRIIIKW